MLSSVLNGPRAIAVNIEIMRALVRLRPLHSEYAELARKIDELEAEYDRRFKAVFDAIEQLMQPPPSAPGRALGFRPQRNRTP